MRTIFLILPYDMSVRTFLRGNLLSMLIDSKRVRLVMASRSPDDVMGSAATWRSIIRPFRRRRSVRMMWSDIRFTLGFLFHLALVYRFNVVHGFRGFLDRLKQSPASRRTAFREGLPVLHPFGFPWPRSARLLTSLQKLYWMGWTRHVAAAEVFDETRPDLVVLFHCQSPFVTPYAQEARNRGIPMLGVNGSWDQPTTKGPLVPGLAEIAVQSAQVKSELTEYHGIAPERIHVTGWPQMDLYADPSTFVARDVFLSRLGLPPQTRYVLIGAYSERLGAHEPAMCLALAQAAAAGLFGPDCIIYVRCHPLELEWEERFRDLHDLPQVVVEPPRLGDLQHLANLIRHAGCVVASAGTINLDAVALDTPSVAVAFEDESLPFYDRPSRRYDMEHIVSVLNAGGLRIARSQQDLHDAVTAYLADPTCDAEGRRSLRERHLEPLDGGASRRLADFILKNVT